MKSQVVAEIVVGVITIGVIVANIFGVYLLMKLKKPYSNQVRIVINISICEIFLSCVNITRSIYRSSYQRDEDSSVMAHLYLLIAAIYFAWYNMFYLLMVDRMFGSCFPFWYQCNASGRWIKIALGVFWFLTLIIALALCLTWPHNMLQHIEKYYWVTLDAIFVLFVCVLYGSVFFIKRRSSARTGRSTNQTDNKRFFAIVSAILMTFVLLQAIPGIIATTAAFLNENAAPYHFYLRIFWSLNLLMHPLIYIFPTPVVWNAFRRYFGTHCQRHAVDSAEKGEQ